MGRRRVFVPLRSAPFERFRAGTKTVEVRDLQSPVAKQVRSAGPGTLVLLRRGYSTTDELRGKLGRVWESRDLSGLPPEVLEMADLEGLDPSQYFDAHKPVLAFEVIQIRRSAASSQG